MTQSGGSGPVLLVSSAGGHFTELRLLADQFEIPLEQRHWVLPRTPQTEGMADQTVTWMPHVTSRDVRGALTNLPRALRLHRQVRPSGVVTAGAAQAIPHLVAASAHRTPITFVESAARTQGPSVSGRVAQRLPGAALRSQTAAFGPRWSVLPDVFGRFLVQPASPRPIDRILVSLGTERFPFERAVRAVMGAAQSATSVVWQTGNTTVEHAGAPLRQWLTPAQLHSELDRASVVVVHGGVGAILDAFGAGHVPVVIPRSPEWGEHVDDHQLTMCRSLAERGMIVMVSPGETLTEGHLQRAAALQTIGPV